MANNDNPTTAIPIDYNLNKCSVIGRIQPGRIRTHLALTR